MVVDDKSEDSKSIWDPESVAIGGDCGVLGLLSVEDDGVVGLQHDELELDVICDEWGPDTFTFLFEVDKELNFVFNLVVLRVRTF